MQIRTKAIFVNEDTQKDEEANFNFDLFEICDANETNEGYTSITNKSTGIRTTVKIKYETFWGLVKKYNHSTLLIIE